MFDNGFAVIILLYSAYLPLYGVGRAYLLLNVGPTLFVLFFLGGFQLTEFNLHFIL